ncbi:MAG: hypothetical protein WBB85_16190, partial [Albidovulum sp.]|uniref:hypothetical protein n=1 Tax=Albidovulum sp. TaxID=1872424 RepID=UPI003C94BF84
ANPVVPAASMLLLALSSRFLLRFHGEFPKIRIASGRRQTPVPPPQHRQLAWEAGDNAISEPDGKHEILWQGQSPEA